GSAGSHALLRRSTNGGTSWATVDNYSPCVTTSTKPLRTQCPTAQGYSFASDSRGNLFVGGYSYNSGGTWPQWTVWENPGGTNAWQIVDLLPTTDGESRAFAVMGDLGGNVYAAGFINSPWVVRKLTAAP